MGTALLDELVEAGFHLTPLGADRIQVEPASRLTAELRETIVAHKPELIAALLERGSDCDTSGLTEESPTRPPDDPLSNEIRYRLLLWGGPLGWPSLVEVGLGAGGKAWTTWLMAASLEDLKQAILAAVRAEQTTLGLDEAARRLWPGAGIVREEESGT